MMIFIIIIMILHCHVYLYTTKKQGLGRLVFKSHVFITSSSSTIYHCDKMLTVNVTVGLISLVQ